MLIFNNQQTLPFLLLSMERNLNFSFERGKFDILSGASASEASRRSERGLDRQFIIYAPS